MIMNRLAVMLPDGILINTHVTQRGNMVIKIEVEPQHASAFLSIGNMLIKAAKEAQAVDASNQLELIQQRAKTKATAKHSFKLQRLALSVFNRTRKRKLASAASGLGLTTIDFIIKDAQKKERTIKRALRNKLIIKLDRKGLNHIVIGSRLNLHQKSITRIVNQAKQGILA